MPEDVLPLSYLALGDSYTIGEGVQPERSFPFQLASMLLQHGINITDPEIVAQTGWTTGELLEALENRRLTGPYNFVTLLIGVNNQYRALPVENFSAEFQKLACQAIVLSGNKKERVFIVSIPDWSVMPFAEGRDRDAISSEIDLFNQAVAVQAMIAGLKFIDITTISRMAEEDLRLIAADGLHPSQKMYALWVSAIVPLVMESLAL